MLTKKLEEVDSKIKTASKGKGVGKGNGKGFGKGKGKGKGKGDGEPDKSRAYGTGRNFRIPRCRAWFKTGECPRGTSCSYLHEPKLRGKAGVCVEYQQGKCEKGDACWY